MVFPQKYSPRIAVIGGGIAGLAAAFRLVELDPNCRPTLFEANSRLGGVLSTLHQQGFQVEQSADNFITTVPWGVNLCKRLGLADQLVQTNPSFRRTFVVRRGRLHPLPDGFLMMAPTRLWPLALTPILSPWGKLRSAVEYFIPPRKNDSDESMAGFVRRRLGSEAFDRLVEPLISAVYAADLEKLGVLPTLPRFREMERQHGSLIRAMRHQIHNRPRGGESGARYSMFVTLQNGLSSLVDAIETRLPKNTVRLESPVTKIERRPDGWRIETPTDTDPSLFDALILATPSPVAAKLLQPFDGDLAADLASIEHSGTAILSLAYEKKQIGHPLNGMGVVVPAVERSPILACSFSSRKYPHRAPDGFELIRVFVGGARRPELAQMDESELRPLILHELERLLQIHDEPCYENLARWPRAMPQYHIGHLDRVCRIETRAAALPHLALAGNAYRGVGIPDCIHSGETAAENLLKQLASSK